MQMTQLPGSSHGSPFINGTLLGPGVEPVAAAAATFFHSSPL